ncbi:hypothetical protein CJD36_016760 [Flavipsychrobacter stenotrophus]|uniref:FtsK domain-containing protein n=1 Tax=Flavipsychrobacter stenotrophus TaxID=2077091 RepID=A0A2S7SRQ6_9BACT|nr:DNA translocase FtsK [Flavipsychrobacter stenotrophus]PQJ09590.1 hypothetical protein CJD36_016760 [Flavipsychrobacter stenotrophus]
MFSWLKRKPKQVDELKKDKQPNLNSSEKSNDLSVYIEDGKAIAERITETINAPTIIGSDISGIMNDTLQHIDVQIQLAVSTIIQTTVLEDYVYPAVTLLNEQPETVRDIDLAALEENKSNLVTALNSFGVNIQSIAATVGPTETLFEIVPAVGVRIAKIVNLKEDISLTLNAPGISIIAPIPGKGTIGISIPNKVRQTVYIRSLIETELSSSDNMELPISLGKRSDNTDYIADLTALPHLLVAGATGQGKSVGINAIIVSLLYRKHPSELKFVMIDTKQVELVAYEPIANYFLAKLPTGKSAIVTDATKAIDTLGALCLEMDNRYELLKDASVRNIKDYHRKAENDSRDYRHKDLPYIVLIIEEFADLMIRSGREVEMPLTRLAQTGRVVGIHLIISTQHPSSDVITANLKANFLGRISFKVTSKINSRTILDVNGAETLLGNGDMLIAINNEVQRIQCAYISNAEVDKVVESIANQQGYPTAYLLPETDTSGWNDATINLRYRDKMFNDCARLVVQMQSGSTSNIQRRFNLGYNKAGRIMDQLEAAGIVGPAYGSNPREVYYKTELEIESFLQSLK